MEIQKQSQELDLNSLQKLLFGFLGNFNSQILMAPD